MRRTFLRIFAGLVALLTAAFYCAHAQVITTVAGTDFRFPPTPLAAIKAPITTKASTGSGGVAVDANGNIYLADSQNNLVVKVDQQGVLKVVAGNGTQDFSGDGGAALSASLNQPTGVAVDATGNIFIADEGNNLIRKVTPSGIISTVAGGGFDGDGGPATSAILNQPVSVAVDATGNIFIADNLNSSIRKVTPSGIISTLAGNGSYVFSGDGGPATNASLNLPSGVV